MYYFRFLLQVIGKCAETLSREKVAVGASACNTQFLLQQVTHLMLYITHMFQSGEKGLTHTVSPVVCMDAVCCLLHTFQLGEKRFTHTICPVVCMDAVCCLSHTCFS